MNDILSNVAHIGNKSIYITDRLTYIKDLIDRARMVNRGIDENMLPGELYEYTEILESLLNAMRESIG